MKVLRVDLREESTPKSTPRVIPSLNEGCVRGKVHKSYTTKSAKSTTVRHA